MNLLSSLPEKTLTRDEENALAKKIKVGGALAETAANDLALHNMREGFLYAKGVGHRITDEGEVFSLTWKALLGSAYRFNPKYGRRFFAFSKARIRGAIKRYWNSLDTVKHASLHELEEDRDVIAEYEDNLGICISHPTNEYRVPATLPAFDVIDFNEQMAVLLPMLREKLNTQEQMVMDLVYIGGFTFEEIGELLDISRSQAQLTRAVALEKLKTEVAKKGDC